MKVFVGMGVLRGGVFEGIRNGACGDGHGGIGGIV